ncbi:VPLPA-CTERM sorting domain-containing protein [Roseovarius sp. S1116L3]|uniref:VPLPA-CTERM sorting domain-containing protein n=1 Tax=Roseovarius roseus TaxID=3342636 RepID=UPI003727B9D9
MKSRFRVEKMKKIFAVGTVILALCGPANAATVSLQSQDEIRLKLSNVSGTSLDFALDDGLSGYANFGGYVKWSTREDGRRDEDGPWSACLECGYEGGSWNLSTYGKRGTTINLDFGGTKDTVYVWTRATWGQGNLTYTVPSSDTVSAVPVPAAGFLLITALGGLTALTRRRRKSARIG